MSTRHPPGGPSAPHPEPGGAPPPAPNRPAKAGGICPSNGGMFFLRQNADGFYASALWLTCACRDVLYDVPFWKILQMTSVGDCSSWLHFDYFRLPRCILRLAMIHTPLFRGDTGFAGPVVSAHIGVALLFPLFVNRQKNTIYSHIMPHVGGIS